MIIQKIMLPGFLTGVIHKSLVGHATCKHHVIVERPQVLAILKQSSEQNNFKNKNGGKHPNFNISTL